MDGNQNDVLKNAPAAPRQPEKHRGRGVSILLGIFLFVSLVALGERAIYDLNRKVNSYTCQEYPSYYDYRYPQQTQQSDDDRLQACSNYKITRLFLILAIVVPVMIIGFALYVKLGFQGEGQYRPVAMAYFAFSFWMIGHLLVETGHFLIQQYTTFGIYVVLVVAIALLTSLILVLQKYRHQS